MKDGSQRCLHITNYIEKVGSYNPNAQVVNETTIIHVTINVNINIRGKRKSCHLNGNRHGRK